MFPEGVEIDPGLTVAMNDDSLYGWIAPGQSKPLPPGTRLSFSSDRPDVVSVDPRGVIRTVANGAATVTATATYHGESASTSFVVRVALRPQRPEGRRRDGRAASGPTSSTTT